MAKDKKRYVELSVDDTVFEQTTETEQQRIEVDLDLLRTYVPEHVLNAVAAGQDVAGERKIVTVVFADVSGFTAMSESMDPEDVTRIMNGCFEALCAEIYRHRGMVDKFIGDCVMALWGVPAATDQDAELAVRASLAMLDALAAYNETLEIPLGLSIGINTGVAVAATVGSSRFRQYTVMGDTVNLAQRLESAAQRDQILVSESVVQSCQERIDFVEHDAVRVKGKSEPVRIFSPVRVHELAGDARKTRTSALPLIGRDDAMARAHLAIQGARRGEGGSICLFADPGLGKSRLLDAIAEVVAEKKLALVRARGHPLTRELDYSLLSAILRQMAGLPPEAGRERVRRGLWQAVERIDDGVLETLTDLLLGRVKLQAGGEDPEVISARVLEAARDWILRAAEERPMVLLVDDVQLSDWQSLRLLARLSSAAINHSLLVVLAGRPQKRLSMINDIGRVDLPALTAEQTAALAAAALQRDDIPDNLTAFLNERAHGNPLQILAYLDGLKAAGQIFLRGRVWRVAREIDATALPGSLAALMAARVDNLDPAERDIVLRAATIGEVVPMDLLRRFAPDFHTMQRVIDRLIQSDLLAIDDQDIEVCYRFLQPAFREAAYDRILRTTRQQWHREIAELLVAEDDQPDLRTQLMITEHFARGDDPVAADHWIERTVARLERQASYAGAHRWAVRRVESLLSEAAEAVLSEADYDRRLLAAHLAAGRLCRIQGDHHGAEIHLEAAATLAERLQDIDRAARIALERGRLLVASGDLSAADKMLRKADELFEQSGRDPELRLDVYLELAQIADKLGQFDDAWLLLRTAMQQIRGPDSDDFVARRIRAVNRMGIAALKAGRPDEAIKRLEQALAVAEKRQIDGERAAVLANIAGYWLACGDPGRAQRETHVALEAAAATGDPFLLARLWYNLATAADACQDIDEARQALTTCRELAERIGWKEGLAMIAVLAPRLGLV
ncbi:MAG: hypothetical protein D6761_02875 [Candidatus Dadabacteria bacterium]|nr:MAG: hypothetical protein D6761_02875 [Candidatus Dadabacteria bacterium]